MDFELLTTEEAAKFLRIVPGTLDNWRSTKNHHIPYIMVGSSIKYDKKDLIKYLQNHRVA